MTNYNSGEVVFLKIFFMKKIFFNEKLSVRVQRTDDTKEKLYFGENVFFSLKLVFARKIRLVLFDSSMGLHTNKDKKNIIWKNLCFFVRVFLKKHFDKVISGSRDFRRWKTKFLFCRTFFSQKTLLSKKTSEMFVVKDQWGTKNDEINWNSYFENNFYGKILWWEIFLKDIVVSGSYRGPTIEKKIILWRNYFFTDFCSPQNID